MYNLDDYIETARKSTKLEREQELAIMFVNDKLIPLLKEQILLNPYAEHFDVLFSDEAKKTITSDIHYLPHVYFDSAILENIAFICKEYYKIDMIQSHSTPFYVQFNYTKK